MNYSLARWALGLGLGFGFALGTPAIAQDAPKQEAKEKSIAQWIADLGHDSFEVREKATEALSKAPTSDLQKLEKALSTDDPEVRWRLEKAIEAVKTRAGARPKSPQRPQMRSKGAPSQGQPDMFGELGKELDRIQPGLNDMLKQLPIQEMLPPELRDAFKDMEKALRGFDQIPGEDAQPGAPRVFRQFKTFRFKDGQWIVEDMTGGAQRGAGQRGIGATASPASPLIKAQLGLGDRSALAIDSVQRGSIAEQAGLVPFDLVLSIDGLDAGSKQDLGRLEIPGTHTISVLRGGEQTKLTYEAKRRPAPRLKRAPAPTPPGEKKGELRKF